MEKNIIQYNLSPKPIVINGKNNHPIYDMYYLEITYDTGEKETIKLFSEHGTIDTETINKKIQKYFLIDRLFGEKGLIKKQGGKDYIFLGRLEKVADGKYKGNTQYLMPNSKETALQYFDRVYEKIEEALENKEKVNQKNYVCSDIHGMYGSYIEAINQLKKQDHLWILGDAADRGENGIQIIQDIMKRTGENGEKPEVTYILGNHDYLFISVMEIMKNYNLTNKDLKDVLEYNYYKNSDLANSQQEKQHFQELSLKLQYLRVDKNVSLATIDFIQNYAYKDGGFFTLWEYANLSEEQQSEIYEFLINSYVFVSKQIGDKKIAFVHTAPPKLKENNQETQLNFKMTFKQMREKCQESTLLSFLQNRGEDEKYQQWKDAGYLTICGHTPLQSEIEDKSKTKGYIRIDTGCSMGGKLALYCIEDEKTKFLPAKEEIGQTQDNNEEQPR